MLCPFKRKNRRIFGGTWFQWFRLIQSVKSCLLGVLAEGARIGETVRPVCFFARPLILKLDDTRTLPLFFADMEGNITAVGGISEGG